MQDFSESIIKFLTDSKDVKKPFWNEQSKNISSYFILPAADFDALLSNNPIKESWFNTRLFHHQNSKIPEIYSKSCESFPINHDDIKLTSSRLIRLSPTAEQKKIFKEWTDGSRFVYNWTINLITACTCVDFNIKLAEISKCATELLPKWTKKIPRAIKEHAIIEAYYACWAAKKAKGKPKFRKRKNPEQSCFISKQAFPQKYPAIYPRISGKVLKFHEKLPTNPKDSRLIWRYGKWFISVSSEKTISKSDNQANGIVAIDPGIRTFATFYSPKLSGKIGESDFSRIYRLLLWADKLYSERAKANSRKRKSLTKAIRRHNGKIKNLVKELHYKTARFLCQNFSLILLPTYEIKQMTKRNKRKINSKTVRSMLGFASYKFKLILKWMASKFGVTILDVSEAYTSKTHPETGKVCNVGSAKYIKLNDGSIVDRDIIGAHNILVKFLTECCALSDTSIICENK